MICLYQVLYVSDMCASVLKALADFHRLGGSAILYVQNIAHCTMNKVYSVECTVYSMYSVEIEQFNVHRYCARKRMIRLQLFYVSAA